MPVIPLNEPKVRKPPKGLVPFALGFRPFFLAATLSAVVLMALWLLFLGGQVKTSYYYDFIGWHSHEMLFGYGVAVIAGFLLTAVRNWTGVDTVIGKPLAAITLLWLAGRVIPFTADLLPAPLIALVDLAFIPALAWVLKGPLWKGSNKVNRRFLPLVLVMGLANLLVHLQALGVAETAARGNTLMINLILLLMIFVVGRVLPFFTEKAIPGARTKRAPQADTAGFYLIIALGLVQLLFPVTWLTAPLAAGLAVTQAVRIYRWYDNRIWGIPILWVLYTGFGWLVLGLLLTALAEIGSFQANLAVHALTAGGIGVFTFGMMARVALGHTGRELKPARIIEIFFIIINLVPLIRVFGPALLPEQYSIWINISGGIWVISFLVFTLIYAPILLKPRVDGHPG